MVRTLFRGALGAAALAIPSLAHAHATLAITEASPDSSYRGVVQIGHGCAGSPTTAVRVTIPEGVIGVRPMPKPGWTLDIVRGPYAKAYPTFHGRTVSEGPKEISWSGGTLPGEHYDEFVFAARFAPDVAAGSVVPFPVVQECREGAHRWVEIAAAGQDPHSLKEPAPTVRIVQAAAQTARPAAAPAAVKAGALVIEGPWTRATPGGAKVAGGYVRITNTGTEPDRLVGASVPVAARGEVHEMSNEGGVMKMRELPQGITVKPGETVELRPGGLHLMFMDLKAGLKEGDTLRGTLVFEKAGTVEVVFAVSGIGARSGPAAGGGAHSHH